MGAVSSIRLFGLEHRVLNEATRHRLQCQCCGVAAGHLARTQCLHLLLKEPDLFGLLLHFHGVLLLLFVEYLRQLLRLLEVFLLVLLYPARSLGQLGLAGFPALPLLLIRLLVFEDLALTFVYYLQEEVLHQAH